MSLRNTLQAKPIQNADAQAPMGNAVERWVGLSAMAVVMVAGFAAVLL